MLVIQGIACESIDQPLDRDTPLAAFVDGLTHAGYTTLRFDKRGVGDSDGDIADFATELADARAALAHAQSLANARGIPLVIFGHSVGGIIAAQLRDAAGIVVYGTPVMRWIECLLDSTERQLALRGQSGRDRARQAAIRALAQTGELNGRSAAYHAQLHALDLEAAWRPSTRRCSCCAVSTTGSCAPMTKRGSPSFARGAATIVDLPHLDHLFGWHADRDASLRDYGIGRADPALVTATVAWLDSVTLAIMTLRACEQCRRHFAAEPACPFCGAAAPAPNHADSRGATVACGCIRWARELLHEQSAAAVRSATTSAARRAAATAADADATALRRSAATRHRAQPRRGCGHQSATGQPARLAGLPPPSGGDDVFAELRPIQLVRELRRKFERGDEPCQRKRR